MVMNTNGPTTWKTEKEDDAPMSAQGNMPDSIYKTDKKQKDYGVTSVQLQSLSSVPVPPNN
jgi:hypothetical protein